VLSKCLTSLCCSFMILKDGAVLVPVS
jgi:hypothetical protein